jgi:hypothetical protein
MLPMKTTKIGSQQIKMNSHYLICTFMICDSCSDVEKYTQYNLVLVLLFSPLLKLIKLWLLMEDYNDNPIIIPPHIVLTDGRQQRQPNHNTTTYFVY